jgi:hypothetical protein
MWQKSWRKCENVLLEKIAMWFFQLFPFVMLKQSKPLIGFYWKIGQVIFLK